MAVCCQTPVLKMFVNWHWHMTCFGGSLVCYFMRRNLTVFYDNHLDMLLFNVIYSSTLFDIWFTWLSFIWNKIHNQQTASLSNSWRKNWFFSSPITTSTSMRLLESGASLKNVYPKSITMTSLWAPWRLKSLASRLFIQPFIQVQIKENIAAPRHWPLCGEFTIDPRTNGQ